MPTPPAHQVCPLCGHDDYVTRVVVDDEWIDSCSSTDHAPIEWRPKEQYAGPSSYRSGIGEDLGVYEDLLNCVTGGFAEYGLIEYRFSQFAPKTYKILVDRYGHTVQGKRKYSASAFLGSALGQLWREELIEGLWGPATGYWNYNSKVGCYATAGTAESSEILSWEDFATGTLGVDPLDWPPLGYIDADQP